MRAVHAFPFLVFPAHSSLNEHGFQNRRIGGLASVCPVAVAGRAEEPSLQSPNSFTRITQPARPKRDVFYSPRFILQNLMEHTGKLPPSPKITRAAEPR